LPKKPKKDKEMAASSGIYSVHGDAQTVSTAITILELTAPATGALEIIRAWVSQASSTTSAMNRIQLLRKTATVTSAASAPTPVPAQVGQAASGITVKWKATAEGTDGVIYQDDAFNILSGYLYLPVPEERIWVPPSGIVALKFPGAPTSANYSFGFVFREVG
jgi:hypothetical protein